MGLKRIATVQGHPIPHTVGGGGVPWDPTLFRGPQKVEFPEPEEFPIGATVLNGMQGVALFSCDLCGTIVAESEMDYHDCGYLAETGDED